MIKKNSMISGLLCVIGILASSLTLSNDQQDSMETAETTPHTFAEKTHYSPIGFSVEYELESDSFAIGGSGKRVLKSLGNDQYRMELTAKSIFLTNREISQFELKGCEIKPKHYRYERTGIGRDKRYLLKFAEDMSTVEYEANKNKQTIELDHPRYLDRLSETLAIQCMLAAGKKNMMIPIVDKDKTKTREFKVIGEELVSTKAGEFNAYQVERVRAPDSSRKTLLWFAPQLNFQLVKMIQIKEGRTFKLTLSRYEL